MAKRLLENGQIVAVEFSRAELAQLWKISEQDLDAWVELIPPTGKNDDGTPVYRFTREEFEGEVKLLMTILRTRMSVKQVKKIIEKGKVHVYAELAEDCPRELGINAHVWRSYAIIVHTQINEGLALDERELAWRAHLYERNPLSGEVELSEELAEKHIRLLANAGLLKANGTQWVYASVPKIVAKILGHSKNA